MPPFPCAPDPLHPGCSSCSLWFGNRSLRSARCAWLGLLLVFSGCGQSPDPEGGPGAGGVGTGGGSGTGGDSAAGGNSSAGGTNAAGGSDATSSGGALGTGGVGVSGAGGTGGAMSSGTILVEATFQERAVGVYSEAMIEGDFGSEPPWNNGLDEGRATIVDEGGEKFLRVTYPGGEFGPGDGGVQFRVPFAAAHEELYFSYRVRFAVG